MPQLVAALRARDQRLGLGDGYGGGAGRVECHPSRRRIPTAAGTSPFPKRFGALEHARAICHDLLAWYNDAHHHSGLSYLTPADVHYGRAPAILDRRHRTRLVAYAAHPERFVSGPPRPETLPTAVWINPPSNTTRHDGPKTDDQQPGRLAACSPCPAATAARSVVVSPRRWRGVATVNAEPSCLKDVDTARPASFALFLVGTVGVPRQLLLPLVRSGFLADAVAAMLLGA